MEPDLNSIADAAAQAGERDICVFGEGPVPAELRRINWAAMLMPSLWSFLYGLWGWWLAFVAAFVASLFASWWVRAGGSPDTLFQRAVIDLAFFGAVNALLSILMAANANAALWSVQQKRLSGRRVFAIARPNTLVSEHIRSQRTWAIIAAVFVVTACLSNLYTGVSFERGQQHARQLAALSVAISAGALAIAWGLDRRARRAAAC